MRFRRMSFGGSRPVFTDQPIMVTGGFNLDTDLQDMPVGAVIPAGTLAVYNEETRLVSIIKTARVTAIDSSDSKIVSLESDEFLTPVFTVGESVVKTVSGNFTDAPTISKIDTKTEGYVLTLSAEITGLSVGDMLIQVVDKSGSAALIGNPTALVITDVKVGLDEVNVDVTVDTGNGAAYERRIPPIPDDLKANGFLKGNHNIKLSKSF